MKLIKTASGKKTIKISKKEWESIGREAGWTKISENVNPINGKSKQSARNYIYRLVGDLTKGFFKDEDWSNVRKIWTTLDSVGIENHLTDNYYKKDDNGNLQSKTWHFEVPFVNNRGKEDKLLGTLNAHFAGSNEDPTDRYDISFII